jgi:erythronate-4-phosphate dehydrogenase
MRIVCDSNMPLAEDAFRTLGEVTLCDGRAITSADVRDADLLAIRSTTRVSRELLHGSRVRFVGTATIGTDHLDQDYLAEAGIAWCYSPGCNANSVSEYLTAALLCLAARHGLRLEGLTLGVIGVGNVGRCVVAKAQALGLQVLRNDPPRQRAEHDTDAFVALPELLAASDIVTLHVPLNRDGQDATWQMVNADFLGAMRPGSVFINAARGGIMSTAAVLAAHARGQLAHMVIDTWEQEPDFSPDLLARADLATPHIAGHSFEGKVQGTVMVYEAACRFLGVEPRWQYRAHMPPPPTPRLDIDADGKPDETVLWQVVRQIYDIESDDRRFRAACDDRRAHFDRLRKQYPMRREFPATAVRVPGGQAGLRRKLAGLGFAVS